MSWLSSSATDQVAILSLAALGLTLPTASLRRRALAGPLLLALAFASLAVAGGEDWRRASLPASYLDITAAIGFAGLALPLGLGWVSHQRAEWTPRLRVGTWLGAGLAVGLGALRLAPLASRGGWGGTLLAAGGLTLAAGAAIALLPRLHSGAAVRRLDRLLGGERDSAPSGGGWDRVAGVLLLVHGGSALLALWAPFLPLLLLLILAGGIAGLLFQYRLDRARTAPLSVVLALLIVAGVGYLMVQVAGDTRLTLGALADAPYSGALELLLALPASLAAWALLRLWPFHIAPRGPLTGLLGAALLIRVVGPLLPSGAFHWQPVLYPLAMLAVAHAAAARRDDEALVACGALGLLAGTGAAGWCGTGLVLAGAALALPEPLRHRMRHGGGELVGRLWVLVLVPLVPPILAGALHAQTVYTVLSVLGLFAVLWAEPGSPRV
jgi:hypothetical protein